jgi:hypothetical protein
MTKLKDLKKGDFFKRRPTSKKVYMKGDYDRSDKTYECNSTDDVWSTGIFIKPNKVVYTDFEY